MEVRTPSYSGTGTLTMVLTYPGSGNIFDIRSSNTNCVTTVRCTADTVAGTVTVNSWLVE
jgi:hypothetical protein